METQPPRCPTCQRALQSRIAKLCSWCGVEVPINLRYSAEEASEIIRIEAEAQASREAVEKERAIEAGKKALVEIACEVAGIGILKSAKTIQNE